MTTPDDVSELTTIIVDFEKAARKLSKRGPFLIGQIIGRGDAQSIGAIRQLQLQALTTSVGSNALVAGLDLHKQLADDAKSVGIDIGPPPSSDGDAIARSSGR